MDIQIVQTSNISAFVGVRASANMSNLGECIEHAFKELKRRRNEIKNIKNPNVTFGISPPNYKGSTGVVDFYCCFEVEPLENLPHGMVHIHLLPRTYSMTHYIGPASKTVTAYNYTTKWIKENGFINDDVSYYFERYDEKAIRESDDDGNEIKIFCPVKKK
ncbi:GyrI-like domain-containing protein [Paenibacillus sp. PL91]|uniref:GyrI-like domain-containing protein n=1 Tax=Paenibacillus sp. PL91 TaxID=2729538 RepID=UPI00145EA2DA|nr:GyrI-like domain-containing protein [Paenibacillus sp. PL91]MBC9205117.1 GyrI-like domain-containing protein [Paenibacillus sp. PL91]